MPWVWDTFWLIKVIFPPLTDCALPLTVVTDDDAVLLLRSVWISSALHNGSANLSAITSGAGGSTARTKSLNPVDAACLEPQWLYSLHGLVAGTGVVCLDLAFIYRMCMRQPCWSSLLIFCICFFVFAFFFVFFNFFIKRLCKNIYIQKYW